MMNDSIGLGAGFSTLCAFWLAYDCILFFFPSIPLLFPKHMQQVGWAFYDGGGGTWLWFWFFIFPGSASVFTPDLALVLLLAASREP